MGNTVQKGKTFVIGVELSIHVLKCCCSVVLPRLLPSGSCLQLAGLSLQYELLYTSENYYNNLIRIMEQMATLRPKIRLRSVDVWGVKDKKKGNESTVVNVTIS